VKALVPIALAGCGVLLPPDGAPTPARVLAHMEKGGCLGECPVYDLTFYADGTVEYRGHYNVLVTGRRWFHLDPKLLEGALAYDFARARYAQAPEDVHVDCTDQQTVTFDYGGKHVEHDYGDSHAPGGLIVLEDALDRLANVDRWVGDYRFAQPQGSYCEDTRTIYLTPPTAP
jgi:hypothetical protein